MPRVIEADYDQVHLLPPTLEEWVGADHPARFVRDFVRSLEVGALGFREPALGNEGRPAYSVELMLRVWLYGYLEKVRSVRGLERACRERMGFVWLCGNRAPDHNSLWRFWNANRAALRALFKRTVKVALELDLIGLVVQALDGTRIQAHCSGRGRHDRAALGKALGRLDELLAEREAALERGEGVAGARGTERYGGFSAEQLRGALARVEAGEARHVHPGEPEARRMKCDGRNRFGYNAQAVVDGAGQLIVAAEVVAEATDAAQLGPMMALAEETLRGAGAGQATPTTLADGGYASGGNFARAQAEGREVLAPMPSASKNSGGDPFHASRFEHDAGRDVVRCPGGRELPFRRLRKRRGATVREYRSAAVCAGCPLRPHCTADRHGRSIEIAPWQDALRRHRDKMGRAENAALYRRRPGIIEPVFGWIKAAMGFRRWTVRGLERVRTQWAMLCTALNLRAIYREWVARLKRAANSGNAAIIPA